MSSARDIIDGIKHRLPSRVNLYPTLNRTVRMVSKRLFFHKSSLVKGALSVTITADSASASLPSDFWGLMEAPYISTDVRPLEPVPDRETKLTYSSNTTPMFYEIMGTTLYLYPGSSSEITIKGAYWSRPTAITKPSDTMPYNELFDDAIQEALLHIYSSGDSTGNPGEIGMLQNFINKSVDEIVPYIEMSAPKRLPSNLDYDAMAEEEW